jgi:hypothetical protein
MDLLPPFGGIEGGLYWGVCFGVVIFKINKFFQEFNKKKASLNQINFHQWCLL